MVPTHARMLSLASYRATASFLDSYQPRIQIQPRPLYSLLNISDILRPAMVRLRRVTVLICGSVCSRLPASHPHGFKSYNNNHFRLFLTLFSIRSTKIWRKKHSIDYLHQNDSKVDMKGFWTDFPPRVWWWWWKYIHGPAPAAAPHCDVEPGKVMPAHTQPQPLSSAAVEWINLSTRVIIRIICIISRVEGSTEFHFFTILYSERTLLLLHCLLCFHAYGCLNTGSSLRIRWSYRELYTIKLFHAILSHFKPRRTLLVVGSLISEYW